MLGASQFLFQTAIKDILRIYFPFRCFVIFTAEKIPDLLKRTSKVIAQPSKSQTQEPLNHT